jgi:hypothetical protein
MDKTLEEEPIKNNTSRGRPRKPKPKEHAESESKALKTPKKPKTSKPKEHAKSEPIQTNPIKTSKPKADPLESDKREILMAETKLKHFKNVEIQYLNALKGLNRYTPTDDGY